MTDYVDGRLIEHHCIVRFTSAELFDVEAVDQIGDFVKATLNTPVVWKIFGGI